MGNLMARVGNWLGMLGGNQTDRIGDVVGIVKGVFWALMGLFSIAAIMFAIYVGMKLARAEEEGKRKEAKQQLLWTIIAIVAVIGIVTILNLVIMPLIEDQIKQP